MLKTDLCNVVFVILNYKDYDLTIKCVEQLKTIYPKVHKVVVDNSPEEIKYVELMKLKDENTCVIKSTKNLGYAAGNNLGIEYAATHWNVDYIGIINPDVELVHGESLYHMISILEEENSMAGITAVQVYNDCFRGIEKSAWKLPRRKNILFYNTKVDIHVGHTCAYKNPVVTYSSRQLPYIKVDVVTGCFFIIKKSILEKIGLLDENTFLYFEENILSYRLAELGYYMGVSLSDYIKHSHCNKQNGLVKRIKSEKYSLYSKMYYCKTYLRLNVFFVIIVYIIGIMDLYVGNLFFDVVKRIIGARKKI